MRLAICNETYVGWPFERVCVDVAACGYDGIEIAPSTLAPDPRDLHEAQAAAVGEVARAAGLEVAASQRVLGRPNAHNVRYLASKRDRAGHFIDMDALMARAAPTD